MNKHFTHFFSSKAAFLFILAFDAPSPRPFLSLDLLLLAISPRSLVRSSRSLSFFLSPPLPIEKSREMATNADGGWPSLKAKSQTDKPRPREETSAGWVKEEKGERGRKLAIDRLLAPQKTHCLSPWWGSERREGKKGRAHNFPSRTLFKAFAHRCIQQKRACPEAREETKVGIK